MIGPMTHLPLETPVLQARADRFPSDPADEAGSGAPVRVPAQSATQAVRSVSLPDRPAQAPMAGDVSRLLALVADRTRLRILHLLAAGERPVVSLTEALRLPQPTVSHHLAWLRMMDLVSPRRQGKHVFYSLGAAAQIDDAGTLTLRADNAVVTIRPSQLVTA